MKPRTIIALAGGVIGWIACNVVLIKKEQARVMDDCMFARDERGRNGEDLVKIRYPAPDREEIR